MSDTTLSLVGQVSFASGAVYAWYFDGLIPDKPMLRFIEGMQAQGLNLEHSTLAGIKRLILRKDEQRRTNLRVASIDDNGF